MKKKLTVDEIRNLKLPCEMYQNGDDNTRIVIALKENSLCYELYSEEERFLYFANSDIKVASETYLFEVGQKGTKYYRCLISCVTSIGFTKRYEYIKEPITENVAVIKKYDDYILLDDDDNLVEE